MIWSVKAQCKNILEYISTYYKMFKDYAITMIYDRGIINNSGISTLKPRYQME